MAEQSEQINVLIVDDHRIVRSGLRTMLETSEGISVVGESSNSTAAIEQASALNPDVILLDVRMPGISGIEAIGHLRTVTTAKIIVLTTYEEQEYLCGAIEAGAHGYMLKTCSLDELIQAIQAVHEGKRLLEPSLVESLINGYERLARKSVAHPVGLSDTELQILTLMAEGATNREIAEALHWSEITVKRKTIGIYQKLNVSDRAQAVADAIRRGLI
jgi:two-component system, NarL family, response regulator DevR